MAEDDFHEFVGAVVAESCSSMCVRPMLSASPSLTDVTTFQAARLGHEIERGEQPGDVERLIIGGGAGRAEAEPLGRHAHRRQHGDRIHFDATDAVFDGMGVITAVAIRHGQPVVEEAEWNLPASRTRPISW